MKTAPTPTKATSTKTDAFTSAVTKPPIRWSLTLFGADLRAGRLTAPIVCLTFAMFAMISIQWLTTALKKTIVYETQKVLSADFILSSPHPLESQQQQVLDQLQAKHRLLLSHTLETPTVVFRHEQTLLVSLKGVDQHYPLKQGLLISPELDGVGVKAERGPSPGGVWVDRDLLIRLNVAVGDSITVGSQSFPITQVIHFEPDRSTRFYNVNPRVMMSMDSLHALGILHPASRVSYRTLIVGEQPGIEQFKAEMDTHLDEHQALKPASESSAALTNAIQRAESFFLIMGICAALLAITALFLVMDRYVKRARPTMSMLRCIGIRRTSMLWVYSLHSGLMLLMGLVFALFGAALLFMLIRWGLVHYQVVRSVHSDALPVVAAVVGSLLVVAAILYYQLEKLLKAPAIDAIKGSQVEHGSDLRQVFSRPTSKEWVALLLLLSGFAIYLFPVVDQPKMVFQLVFGLVGIALVGYSGGWVALWVVNRLAPRLPLVGQMALAQWQSLRRLNLFQVAIFSVIVTCFSLILVVKGDLFDRWQRQLPPETPNYFLMNVFSEQVEALNQLLQEKSISRSHFYPIKRGRLVKLNGEYLREAVSKEKERVNALERELNITWGVERPKDNQIVAGAWWQPEDHGTAKVSVEAELAEKLGIVLNDQLTFSFAGEELVAEVASIRTVEWDSFQPNFYIMFAPDYFPMEEATFLGSLYIPEEPSSDAQKNSRAIIAEIVQRYPQVTLISVGHLLKQVRSMLDIVSNTLYVALGYMSIATLLVLSAALFASWDERVTSGSVMRTLGASRQFLRKMTLYEYLFMGGCIGFVSIVLVEILSAATAYFLFSLPMQWHPSLWVGLLVSVMLFFLGIGVVTQKMVVVRSRAGFR